VAFEFLLHFVRDLYQPLHDSDGHDRGGNDERVSTAGFEAGNLRHDWDTEFVDQFGPDAKTIASDLIGHITRDQVMQWRAGDVPGWAQEAFRIAKGTRTVNVPGPTPVAVIVCQTWTPPRPLRCRYNSARPTCGSRRS
jgi:hypothetical protein